MGGRLLCQSNRLSIGGILPLVAVELGLTVQQRGQILSAFPLGYMLTQVLGGIAADRFGGRLVLLAALLSVGVGVLTIAGLSSFGGIIAVMFVMGFMEGPSFPTNGVVMARWIPGSERASATGITEAGGPLGALVALFLTPVMAATWGWRLTMAVAGVVTLAYAALWYLKACDGPDICGYISQEERRELAAQGLGSTSKGSKGASGDAGGNPTNGSGDHAGKPWRVVLLPSVWAVFLAHAAFNYSRYMLYNWILTYFTEALGVSVAVAGGYMLWPNLVDAIVSLLVGRVADAVANSGAMSTLATRRLFSAVAFMATGIGAAMLPAAESLAAATALVTVAAAAQALHTAGFKSSYADLSKEHSGLLRGLGNTIGTCSSFLVPLVAAGLLERGGGPSQKAAWHAVFGSVLVCNIFGAVAYVGLVSTESIDGRVKKE